MFSVDSVNNEERQNKDHENLVTILPRFSSGGAERVTLNILNGLSNRGMKVSVLCLDSDGPLRKQLNPNVEVVSLNTKSLRRSVFMICKQIRRIQPAFLFTSLGYINVAVMLMKPFFPGRMRIILREANLPSMSLPRAKYSFLMRIAYFLLYRFSHVLICSSERMRREFVHTYKVPPSRAKLLPNPVDQSWLRSRSRAADVVVTSRRRFIAMGRLVPQKGFDNLLRMFAQLRADDSELVILGEGPDESRLKELADRLGISGRVMFLGYIDNPWAWIISSDAFLMPSRWEGMPNAVLESLAVGVPVIASPESGGILEVAESSPVGAVRIARVGTEFIYAMEAVPVRDKNTIPSTLLPEKYDLNSVVEKFVLWLG